MAISETVNIEQIRFQNNEDVTLSYTESRASSWNGRGVSLGSISVALVAVVALAVLAKGANAYSYNTWWDTECGYNAWGDYVCWDKVCHLEEVCTHYWGIARCHLEEVCTHFN